MRTFCVSDREEIYRISNAKFDRLLNGCSGEAIPRLAEKRVRYASLAVRMESRKPVQVVRIWFGYLQFDEQGALDRDQFMEEGAFMLGAANLLLADRMPGNVVAAEARFAKRRIENVIQWKPSVQLKRTLFDGALGEISCKRL